ncbi:MAG: hypothetical protein ABFQ95_06010 [Pseudomonadota bacterium]
MASFETELTLSIGGLPPFSARGCTQSLTPIVNGELRRTVNGELIYTGNSLHEKYKSVIKGVDKSAAAFDAIWVGAKVKVGCIQRLWQKFSGDKVVLSRDPVVGSVIAQDNTSQNIEVRSCKGRNIKLLKPVEEGYISYCPYLDMRVVDLSYATDEWGMQVSWELVLEEV